jgi:biotin carboxyl carrier protein
MTDKIVGELTTFSELNARAILQEEQIEKLRHELAVARENVESLWLQREQQRATINGLHAELEAAQEAAAVARAENEELRDIVHATAVGDEVVAGMAGMMVSELVALSVRKGDEIQELRGVIRDAAEKLEEALYSDRRLADDVVEVVGQLREVLR